MKSSTSLVAQHIGFFEEKHKNAAVQARLDNPSMSFSGVKTEAFLLASFASASKEAKDKGDLGLQKQLADTCTKQAQSAILTLQNAEFRYKIAAQFLHMASEIAKDIGDLALQKEISQICQSIAYPWQLSLIDFIDLSTLRAMNDPGAIAICLGGLLIDMDPEGFMITRKIDLDPEENKRILWLFAGISLVVDFQGVKSYPPPILEIREEIKNRFIPNQSTLSVIQQGNFPAALSKIIIGYLEGIIDMDTVRDYAPPRPSYCR